MNFQFGRGEGAVDRDDAETAGTVNDESQEQQQQQQHDPQQPWPMFGGRFTFETVPPAVPVAGRTFGFGLPVAGPAPPDDDMDVSNNPPPPPRRDDEDDRAIVAEVRPAALGDGDERNLDARGARFVFGIPQRPVDADGDVQMAGVRRPGAINNEFAFGATAARPGANQNLPVARPVDGAAVGGGWQVGVAHAPPADHNARRVGEFAEAHRRQLRQRQFRDRLRIHRRADRDRDEAVMDWFEDIDMMNDMEVRDRAALRFMMARDADDVVAGDNPRPLFRRRIAVDDENDDDDGDDPAPANFLQRLAALRAQDRVTAENTVSSYLFDLIKEDRTCVSVLSGWSASSQSCGTVVEHCNNHPEQASYVSPQGRPVIHEACLRGACRHVIQALAAANPSSVYERDNQGNTALHLLFVDFSSALSGVHSSIYGRPKDMDQLVSDLLAVPPPDVGQPQQQNDNQPNPFPNRHPPGYLLAASSNREGNTPLHMACMASEAIIDPNTMVQLVQAHPESAGMMNNKFQSPFSLHCRRRNASVSIASLLVEALSPRNNATNVPRLTANEVFRQALQDENIFRNENNVVEGNNGTPRALTRLDGEKGWAPIHYAAANNNIELVKFIVRKFPGAAIVRTSQNQSALHLLCQRQQHNHHFAASASGGGDAPTAGGDHMLEAVDLLLRVDAASALQQDTRSYTPLHVICKQGGYGTIRRTAGSRNTNDASGVSTLQVVKRLLQAQPRAATLPDSERYLPLHHACEVGCPPEIIQALLDGNPASAQAETRKHDTALSLACTCNKPESVETVKILIKANPHALKQKNDYGFVPLHCICRSYQPRMGIVQALVDANPSSVYLQTNAGETATHLASSNSTAFVGILQLLTSTQKKTKQPPMLKSPPVSTEDENRTNHLKSRIGNTPLHDACFRASPFEHIETLAMANPQWISVKNHGGLTPLQILCKNGRLDERTIVTFANIGGAEIFAVVDENNNTPLHSAMREDTNAQALRCLVRAFPNALHAKTVYGDSPLHLAIFRRSSPDIVREVAMTASGKQASPMLEPNLAGQTPIGIAIEEFERVCRPVSTIGCFVSCDYNREQIRVFFVLATLVKILYYGPERCQNEDLKDLSLLHACVSIHRMGIRLDPIFIRRAIHLFPGEVKIADENGDYPLTIEAGIPIEKMTLLHAPSGCCAGRCNCRDGILRILLEIYPDACKSSNNGGNFPLGLMIQNGRAWGPTIALALQAFPPALHMHKGLDGKILPLLFEKASKECGTEVVYSLLSSRPDLLFEDPVD